MQKRLTKLLIKSKCLYSVFELNDFIFYLLFTFFKSLKMLQFFDLLLSDKNPLLFNTSIFILLLFSISFNCSFLVIMLLHLFLKQFNRLNATFCKLLSCSFCNIFDVVRFSYLAKSHYLVLFWLIFSMKNLRWYLLKI